MRKTYLKSIFDRYKQSSKGLLSAGVMIDNDRTTKLQAVKPDRHTLAIFMPKIYGPTKPTFTTGINTQRHFFARPQFEVMPSYVGLRKPNKRPFTGNKLRRLVAVVIPDAIFYGVQILTKLQGVSND